MIQDRILTNCLVRLALEKPAEVLLDVFRVELGWEHSRHMVVNPPPPLKSSVEEGKRDSQLLIFVVITPHRSSMISTLARS